MQTGSGKTHTMEGSMDNGEVAGVIPRAVYNIFDRLEKMRGAIYQVHVTHIEVSYFYQELNGEGVI